MKPGLPAPARSWPDRLRALKNLPPVLFLLWSSGPVLVSISTALRVFTALLPVTVLFVSKLLIDSIVARIQGRQIADSYIWWLAGAEFFLAAAGTIIGRVIDYCDGR